MRPGIDLAELDSHCENGYFQIVTTKASLIEGVVSKVVFLSYLGDLIVAKGLSILPEHDMYPMDVLEEET